MIALIAGVAATTLLFLLVLPRSRSSWLARVGILTAIGCLGFAYAAAHATWRMADELAFEDEGSDITVVGVVASLPVRLERGVRFELDVERVVAPGVHVPSRVLLGWYSRDPGGDDAVAARRAMGVYRATEAPARHDESGRIRFRSMDARAKFACVRLRACGS